MKKLFLMALMIVPLMTLSACGFEVVDAGNTGVKKKLGEVQEETLPPGWYMVNPFTTSIIEMNNQEQRQDGSSPAYTKDVQQATIQYVLNYYLEPKVSAEIYAEVGMDWEAKLIPQIVQSNLKNVIGKWNAMDLVANRQRANSEITALVRDNLATRGINVKELSITNIDFEKPFEDAVEAKVVAVQKAEEAKNTTVRVQEEANQRIIAAKADAEAMQIKTAALEKSQSLVLYEAVQKWNGILPQIMAGDAGTILNIPPLQ